MDKEQNKGGYVFVACINGRPMREIFPPEKEKTRVQQAFDALDIDAKHAQALHENELFDAIRDGMDIEDISYADRPLANKIIVMERILRDEHSCFIYRVHPKYAADPYLKFKEALARGDTVMIKRYNGALIRAPREPNYDAPPDCYKIIQKTFSYDMALWLAKLGFYVQSTEWLPLYHQYRALMNPSEGFLRLEKSGEIIISTSSVWRLCKDQTPKKAPELDGFESQQEIWKHLADNGKVKNKNTKDIWHFRDGYLRRDPGSADITPSFAQPQMWVKA